MVGIVAAVNWDTFGAFGGFVVGAIVAVGGVGVRLLRAAQKDATREVIKDEITPLMARMDDRITALEEDNVEHKVFRARMEGIAEGHKQAREET